MYDCFECTNGCSDVIGIDPFIPMAEWVQKPDSMFTDKKFELK